MGEDVGVHHQPNGPAFDVALILHVGCVVVGLTTTVASALTARRLQTLLRSAAPFPDAIRRYFRPGVNWAGRTIYGIPIFGFLLLALGHGAYALHDGWIMGGLTLFVGMVLLAEGLMWPAERRLQVSLAAVSGGGVPAEQSVHRDATTMVWAAMVILFLLVAGSALMVAQP